MIRAIRTFEIEFRPNRRGLLVFSPKVREACKSCKRYGKKATCPPHAESTDYYKKVLSTYKHGCLIVRIYPSAGAWQTIGAASTKDVNSRVLEFRDTLINRGKYFSIGFGAGSCKLCSACQFPCLQPSKSLVPLEATGLDVVETVKRIARFKIKFPVKDTFYRIGAIFYD